MPNVRYICLSDLHLGADDSLLTDLKMENDQTNPISPSPVLLGLAEILSEVLRHNDLAAPKPALILNGDFLELALCPTEQALMVAGQFFKVTGDLFSEIIFVPGNHDHHLWEAAREAQYLSYLRCLPPSVEPQAPWSTTKVFMDMQGKDRLVCGLLSEVARREVLVAYPNFGLRGKDGLSVVFHHGHFTEPAYCLMSTLMSMIFPQQDLPDSVYSLEKENAAWIDFLWSLQGNCGAVGRDIDVIYEAAADESSLKPLADNLARSLAQRKEIPGVGPAWAKEFVLRQLLQRYVVKRFAGARELQRSSKGFDWYFGDLLRTQIAEENGPVPLPSTLVFGHTHRPSECLAALPGYAGKVRVLNTGGWVVDGTKPDLEHGAAAVLIDEDLNALNLRLYNEGRYEVRLEEPSPHSEFYNRICRFVQPDRDPWRAFSKTAGAEVALRAANRARRVQERSAA